MFDLANIAIDSMLLSSKLQKFSFKDEIFKSKRSDASYASPRKLHLICSQSLGTIPIAIFPRRGIFSEQWDKDSQKEIIDCNIKTSSPRNTRDKYSIRPTDSSPRSIANDGVFAMLFKIDRKN